MGSSSPWFGSTSTEKSMPLVAVVVVASPANDAIGINQGISNRGLLWTVLWKFGSGRGSLQVRLFLQQTMIDGWSTVQATTHTPKGRIAVLPTMDLPNPPALPAITAVVVSSSSSSSLLGLFLLPSLSFSAIRAQPSWSLSLSFVPS